MKWAFIILGAHGLIFFGQIKTKPPKVSHYRVPRSWHDNYCYVCVCNSVSGTALAICSQSKGELNSYSFCWQCTHTDQPTDVRLFVCMLILTVHVIIIFTHSAMNAVEVGYSFLWASSTIDRKWIIINIFYVIVHWFIIVAFAISFIP